MNKPVPQSRADPTRPEDNSEPNTSANVESVEDFEPVRLGYLPCLLCGLVVHQCVTLFPCLHHVSANQFCGGCLSGWTQDKLYCPYCNERFLKAKRNPVVDELLSEYLKTHPGDQRSEEDKWDLERRNRYKIEVPSIRKDLSMAAPQLPKPKAVESKEIHPKQPEAKPLPPVHPDPKQACFWLGPPRCPQCHKHVDGYRCIKDQEHVDCYLCKQSMPCRPGMPQQCFICELYFCNIYFKRAKHCDLGIHTVDWYARSTFSQIPSEALCENPYEQTLLKDSLRRIGLPLQMLALHVVEEMSTTGLSFTIDGKAGVQVTRGTFLCGACATTLWSEMLMFQRVRMNESLPLNIRERPRCRHGIHCRNQRTIYAHAFKFNHLV